MNNSDNSSSLSKRQIDIPNLAKFLYTIIKYSSLSKSKSNLQGYWELCDRKLLEKPSTPPSEQKPHEEFIFELSKWLRTESPPPKKKEQINETSDQSPIPMFLISKSGREQRTEYDIGMSDEFLKESSKADAKLRGRILDAVGKISRKPDTPQGDTIKPLTGDLKGLWRYRVGDYRLVYLPDPIKRRVTLVTVAARGSVYD